MMIGDFCILDEAAFVKAVSLGEVLAGDRGQNGIRQRFDPSIEGGQNIGSDIAAVGSGIGHHLVAFIEALKDIQRFFCAEIKEGVGIPLKSGQIVRQGEGIVFSSRYTSLTVPLLPVILAWYSLANSSVSIRLVSSVGHSVAEIGPNRAFRVQ